MISLSLNNYSLAYYHKLVKCWLLKKMHGNKSKTNITGHHCNDHLCVICRTRFQKFDLPKLFIDYLTEDKIDLLLTGKPRDLLVLNQEFLNLNLEDMGNKSVKQLFVNSGYKNWFQPIYGIEFLNQINQDTCTYCNRNYTISIVKNRAKAELDHWFPKSNYPFLALSFYNIIPSCHSCNHLKLDKNTDDSFAHPYMMKEENHNFKYSFDYDTSISNIEIKLIVDKDSKIEKSLKSLKIQEIYQAHSHKELKDLLDLRYKYSENYINVLLDETFEKVGLTKEEIYRVIFGIEIKEEDYHKRPFSKFKHDIIEELKKIK